MYNFQVPELLDAWKDFSQGEDGVVFTIWNPSWLFWFPPMKKPFTHWAYLPIDAEGPNGKLPAWANDDHQQFRPQTCLQRMVRKDD